MKFIYLLEGSETAIAVAETLFADLAAGSDDAAIRVNPVIDRNFSVDPIVSAGGQVIDTVLEVWLPEESTMRSRSVS